MSTPTSTSNPSQDYDKELEQKHKALKVILEERLKALENENEVLKQRIAATISKEEESGTPVSEQKQNDLAEHMRRINQPALHDRPHLQASAFCPALEHPSVLKNQATIMYHYRPQPRRQSSRSENDDDFVPAPAFIDVFVPMDVYDREHVVRVHPCQPPANLPSIMIRDPNHQQHHPAPRLESGFPHPPPRLRSRSPLMERRNRRSRNVSAASSSAAVVKAEADAGDAFHISSVSPAIADHTSNIEQHAAQPPADPALIGPGRARKPAFKSAKRWLWWKIGLRAQCDWPPLPEGSYPWSPKFAAEWTKANLDAWKTFDYRKGNAELPVDPETRTWDIIKNSGVVKETMAEIAAERKEKSQTLPGGTDQDRERRQNELDAFFERKRQEMRDDHQARVTRIKTSRRN
ncbi:hypothetical protein QBC44DRAFT_306355 [Cladorrhinum sp. PSN332]|nr:hypothetical protein QBC44DRAFT_306355 [Cladorrhinum sp. PSN332]